MDEKYMQSDWIGENKVNDTPVCEKIEKFNQLTNMQKYYISILEECMDLGDHEKIKKLNLLIKLQKEYISNLEEGVDLRDQLIKKYEGWVNHDITKELYLKANETIKELQSEIDASRTDDSHIKA